MLQSIGSQRVGFDLAAEEQSTQCGEDPGDGRACCAEKCGVRDMHSAEGAGTEPEGGE